MYYDARNHECQSFLLFQEEYVLLSSIVKAGWVGQTGGPVRCSRKLLRLYSGKSANIPKKNVIILTN